MKIFSSNGTTITGTVQKVIETGKGFLLNTQYYTKDVLAPVPFEYFNKGGTQYNLSLCKTMYLQAYSWNDSYNYFGITKDNAIENRYYMRMASGYVSGTRNEHICIFDEKDNTIQYATHINSADIQFLDVIDQDDTWVYYTYKSNLTWYIARFNKQNYSHASLYSQACSTSYPNPIVLHKSNEYIHVVCYVNNYYSFVLINKVTGAGSVVGTLWRGSNTDTTVLRSSVVFDKNSVIQKNDLVYGVFGVDIGNRSQPIGLYTINTFDNSVSYEPYTTTWNGTCTELKVDTTIYSNFNKYKIWMLEINGTKYLNIGVFNQNFENVKHVEEQGIYTFKINQTTKTATFVGYNQIDELQQIHGMLLTNSKRHMLIGKRNAFQVVKFDTITEKYELTNDVITDCYCVGLDEMERIWYEKTNGAVNMINLQDAQSVQISFEKPYYEYTGNSINTYIMFSALNYLNNDFLGRFKLTLSGPAVFSETGAPELEVSYNGGKLQIGIIITGASPITIYPEYIG